MMAEDLHVTEVRAGERFAFGDNWARFLGELNEERIRLAEVSLQTMLRSADLKGVRFLDVGSGSGLFSLAARRLGARVHSFDYDPSSVACTQALKGRFYSTDTEWTVERGSVLDEGYLRRLGSWDVVYSWGVLHHTGRMKLALDNVGRVVADGGRLFIAIYNDQGRSTKMWLRTKKLYNRLPRSLRWLVVGPAALRLWGPTIVRDAMRGRPLASWNSYAVASTRGMSPWRDVVDWVGGLPFEVAKPEEIFEFYRLRGFGLENLRTCAGGHGCNEYVFLRTKSGPLAPVITESAGA